VKFGIVVPAALTVGIGLLRRQIWPRKPAYAILGAYVLVGWSVAGMGWSMLISGDPDALVALVIDLGDRDPCGGVVFAYFLYLLPAVSGHRHYRPPRSTSAGETALARSVCWNPPVTEGCSPSLNPLAIGERDRMSAAGRSYDCISKPLGILRLPRVREAPFRVQSRCDGVMTVLFVCPSGPGGPGGVGESVTGSPGMSQVDSFGDAVRDIALNRPFRPVTMRARTTYPHNAEIRAMNPR
jgi:hypothetical protein